jgi:peptidylprolyl isomerase
MPMQILSFPRRARAPRRLLAVAAGLAATVALAACSSSPSSSASNTTTSNQTHSGSGASTAVGTIPVADRSPAGSSGAEPTVTVPSGTPPTQLESADLIEGSGPSAAPGNALTVQYTLATYSSGKVIQSSWSANQPFTFTLGAGQVIPGWDKGVVGMKAGGRRELIIPPSLGYGAQSPGPGIAPNDTLVFVIDLQKIG